MNTFARSFFLILFVVAMNSVLRADWVQTGGLNSGTINVLAVSGTTIFAGTPANGIVRSSDNGSTWAASNSGITDTNITALTAVDSTIYAGSSTGNVYISTNNGGIWSNIGSTSASIPVTAIAISGKYLVVSVTNNLRGGISLSTNNGATWSDTTYGLNDNSIISLALNGSAIYAGTYYGNVYQSVDNGTHWTTLGNVVYPIRSLAVYDSYLLAGTTGGGVLFSSNNGAIWVPVDNGLTDSNVNSMLVSGSTVFAGTDSGFFTLAFPSTTWAPANTGLTNSHINSLASNSTNLFAATIGGVFNSISSGSEWTAIGFPQSNIFALAASARNGNLYAGAPGGSAFVSSDSGAIWELQNSGLPKSDILSLANVGSYLFAGTANDIYLSSNNGSEWENTDNNELVGQSVNTIIVQGTKLFSGANSQTYGGAVFISEDLGTTWLATNTDFSRTTITSLAANGAYVFAATFGEGVYVSNDSGNDFNAMNKGLTQLYVKALTMNGNVLIAGTNGGVFVSSDNGADWDSVGLGSMDIYSLIVANTTLIAGTSGGVFFSADNGAHWTASNNGLTNVSINTFAVSGANLYAGATNGYVWRSPLSDFIVKTPVFSSTADSIVINLASNPKTYTDTITIKNIGNATLIIDTVVSTNTAITTSKPDSILPGNTQQVIISANVATLKTGTSYIIVSTNAPAKPIDTIRVVVHGSTAVHELNATASEWLAQNYPNPFGTTTTIDFSLPATENVSLKVYNALGEKVATLANGVFIAGAHSLVFDAHGLPNGDYFFRLSSGKIVQIQKMEILH